jgi:serine/threonine protein kinase
MEATLLGGRFRLAPRELGRGSQGRVCVAEDTVDGCQVAAKVFAGAGKGSYEAGIHRRISAHKHVVKFVDFVERATLSTEGGGSEEEHAVLLIEFVNGADLFDVLLSGGAFPEEVARPIFGELASGVAHCHANGVAHRDIKLENVLLSADGHVKLADFGLAGIFRLNPADPVRLLQDRCGSKAYVSPEIVESRTAPYSGPAADVWSAGVCLFAMLSNFFPFDVACPVRDWRVPLVLEAQARGESTCLKLYALARRTCPFTPELVELLDSMLAFDPAKRVSLDAVIGSPWMTAPLAPAPTARTASGDESEQSVDADDLVDALVGTQMSYGGGGDSLVLDDECDEHGAGGFRDLSCILSATDFAYGVAIAEDVFSEGDEVYRSIGDCVHAPPHAEHDVPHLRRIRADEPW